MVCLKPVEIRSIQITRWKMGLGKHFAGPNALGNAYGASTRSAPRCRMYHMPRESSRKSLCPILFTLGEIPLSELKQRRAFPNHTFAALYAEPRCLSLKNGKKRLAAINGQGGPKASFHPAMVRFQVQTL